MSEDGKLLLHGAGPSLPDSYNKAIHRFPVGFGQGSCGTAAYTGERVIVEDINTHPYWEDIKELAQKANLASCWSEPIIDPSGKILGTFAIYHNSIHTPNTSDLDLISNLADLTAIVIDRCRMIDQLEENKNKFKTLADASYEAVCILDGDKIIEANQRTSRMTGYSDIDLNQMSIYNFIPKENWISSKEDKYQFETIAIKSDGTKIDVTVNVKNAIFNDKTVSLLSINDITRLKQAETERKILSQSIIQSPVSVVVTDYDGKIEFVNPKFIELTGYAPHEVKDKNQRILSSGNNALNTYQNLWKTIKSGQEWHGELQNKKKNGELFWEYVNISALKDKDGKITHFIAVKEDITEKKRQETIQQIILNISNAVFTHETLFEFIEYVRCELGKLINTTNFFVALYDHKNETFSLPFHKDELDSLESFPKSGTISGWVIDNKKALLANAQTLKEMASRGEVELHGASSKIWLGMPLKGKEGEEVMGVLVIQSYEDESVVTEKDKEVLELVSHQVSISIQKKKNEDDLRKALNKATESDRLKSSFLATMSHELRTPLNAVLGFSNLVDLDTPIETAVEFCKTINNSGLQLLSLVEDLFDISSIQSGNIKIEYNKCSIFSLLHEIEVLIKEEQQAKNKTHIELKLIIPTNINDIFIETDSKRFKQIFLNLLKNALKFTEKGKIEFGFSLKNSNSDIPVQFFVKDTGIGISSDIQDSIFDMFRQANETSSRQYEGTGIGLSISKKLVELLGGKIWLKSKLNEGSTFYFDHPCFQFKDENSRSNFIKN